MALGIFIRSVCFRMVATMQKKSNNTSISVCVSNDTADCVKSVLDCSKFNDKLNKEGLTVDDTSKLLRLAIVNLLNTDVEHIKKSIVHSDSDAKLLKFLRSQVLEKKRE